MVRVGLEREVIRFDALRLYLLSGNGGFAVIVISVNRNRVALFRIRLSLGPALLPMLTL